MKKIVWFLIYALVAFTAGSGLYNGWQDFNHSVASWEKFVALLNIAYGVAAIFALYALLKKKSWAFVATVIWAVVTISCAMAAIAVFTERDSLAAALLGGGLSLLAIFIPLLIFIRKN